MNVWKLTAANTLTKLDESPRPVEGKLRVRVTKVYVNIEDALIYTGQRRVKYPIVPGRYAVGLVADENGGTRFPKNARVLLHNYLPAEDSGTEERTFTEDEFRICGLTEDGFLRDFVYVREDEMTLLPDAISDEKALLLPLVALAKATVETLGVTRGQHIAVIGGSILGLFVSRLLIYHQAAPLLIDRRKDRLEFARSRGVYYTSLNDEHIMNIVGTITGGRLADGVVYVPSAQIDGKDLALDVCSVGKHIAFCGITAASTPIDMCGFIRKRLTLHGVCDGTDYIETAINLMANKAVDVSAFRATTIPADRAAALFDELASAPERPVDEIYILNLV